MINKKRILALIPARGDSKRLPRKNALSLAGKPLVAWSIDAALKSKYIDDIIVSTDDNEIAQISKEYGANVPFIRPEELSTDTADTQSVIKHCLEYLQNNSKKYDLVIVLQPTSPLRTASHIDKAIRLFETKNATSVISVCQCDHSPLWANTLDENQSLRDFIKPEIRGLRSQDLPQYYRLNGALYIYDIADIIELGNAPYGQGSYAYVMDREFSIDIDTEIDFRFAELFLSSMSHLEKGL